MKRVKFILSFDIPEKELESEEFKEFEAEFNDPDAIKELKDNNDIGATNIRCRVKITDV